MGVANAAELVDAGDSAFLATRATPHSLFRPGSILLGQSWQAFAAPYDCYNRHRGDVMRLIVWQILTGGQTGQNTLQRRIVTLMLKPDKFRGSRVIR